MMKRRRYQFRCLFIVAVFLLSTITARSVTEADGDVQRNKTRKYEVNLLAVGDDLIHDTVYKSAQKGNSYDFNGIFKNTRSYIKKADLSVINQETILVGKRYSGYPAFGSPYQVADAIHQNGFDVVTSATNHTMDRGASAVLGTIAYWRRYHNIKVLGIHSSQKDANSIKVVTKNHIRFALLNYTYGLNGFRLPSKQKYLIDLLSSRQKIKQDIIKAKKISDFVIVFPHWGIEYQYQPSAYQKSWAKFFSDQGVDLVIGTHPHVLEPCVVMKNKKGHRCVIYYSLGNFVSAQSKPNRMLGGMAEVKIVKDQKGTYIKRYKLSASVTHINTHQTSFKVYKLDDYNDQLSQNHRMRRLGYKNFNVAYLKNQYRLAVGSSYPLNKAL